MASPDITQDIPLNVGNPGTSGFWTNNAEDYDIAIGGEPYMLAPTDQTPYQRETAPYRKDQFDAAAEPGEQSLTGWWIRSQSSFHIGQGIKFYDPSAGESTKYRFTDSQGVDVWTKGQATLLKNVTEGQVTYAGLATNKKPQQHIRSIQYSGTDAVLLHDGYIIDRVDSDGTIVHWVNYNAATRDPIFSICDDGKYGYWVTNDAISGKLEFNRKLLSDGASVNPTVMFTKVGLTVTSAVIEFVKDRIIACINNEVYEISPTATALPSTASYTNPNTNYVYTSITASGPAIYTSGNSGLYSSIQKYTLTTGGAMPVMTQASVAAELPIGETIFKIFYYLGFMLIGTSRGVRAAFVQATDGSLAYGPLIITTTQPVYDLAARDRFVWATATIGTYDAGLIRIDLSQTIEGEALRYAYANDLQYAQTAQHQTTAVAFIGSTNRLAFSTEYRTTSGHLYFEDSTNLVPTGYITTGAIRYGTLEPKNFKLIRGRGDFTYGAMDLRSIDAAGNLYTIITYNSAVGTPEAATTNPEGPQEYLSYKFTLSRSASDTSRGPVFKGYQTKALPATARQRLIQFPVWCFDVETDRYNVKTGYEGRAWERIQTLEQIERLGDIINVQDFTTGERVQAVIEKINFLRKTPPSGNFSGFGGLLSITVRTVL